MKQKIIKIYSIFLIIILVTGFISGFSGTYRVNEKGEVIYIDENGNEIDSYSAPSNEIKNMLDFVKKTYGVGEISMVNNIYQIKTDYGIVQINPSTIEFGNMGGFFGIKFHVDKSGLYEQGSNMAGQYEYGVSYGDIIYSRNENGEEIFRLDGWGTIKIGEQEFENIKDAEFRVDGNGKILYAKFKVLDSVSEDDLNKYNYKFEHNNKRYTFRPNKEGLIEFDPENNRISGENLRELLWSTLDENDNEVGTYKFYMGDKFKEDSMRSNGQVYLSFNNDGSLKQIDFKNGILSTPNDGNIYTLSDEGASVVFNREDYDRLADEGVKNLILLGEDRIVLNGEVHSDSGLGGADTRYYHGKKGSVAEFDRENKKFIIKKGDMTFGELGIEIEIKNGETFFRRTGASFGNFKYEYTNKNGFLEEGEVTSEGFKFKISKDSEVFFDDFIHESLSKTRIGVKELVYSEIQKELIRAKDAVLFEELSRMDMEEEGWDEKNLEYLQNKLELRKVSDESDSLGKILIDIIDRIQKLESEENSGEILGKYYKLSFEIRQQELVDSGYTMAVKDTEKEGIEEISFYKDKKLLFTGKRTKNENIWEDGDPWFDFSIYSGFKYREQQMLEDLSKAYQNGAYTNEELALKEAEVYMSVGEYDKTVKKIDNSIRNLNFNNDELSTAYAKKGMALFLEGNNPKASAEAIDKAEKLNKNNPEVIIARSSFDHAQVSAISSAASQEGKASFRDVKVLTSDLSGSGWQWVMNAGVILGSPYTTADTIGNINEYLEQVGLNIERADKIGIAAEQMKLLIEQGVRLKDYPGMSYSDQFLSNWAASGYSSVLPTEELADILSDYRFTSASDSEKQSIMINMLSERGYSPDSPQLQEAFLETMKNLALIKWATDGQERDDTLASLMYPTKFVPPGGRIGEEIKINTAKYAALFAADIVLNPLNFIGAGLAARGASAAEMQGLKLGMFMGLKSGAVNTIEAWSRVTARQLMKSYMTEMIDGAVSVGLVSLAEINPELAKNIGLGLGIVAGSVFAGGGLSKLAGLGRKGKLGAKVFTDLSDGSKFYVRNSGDLAEIQAKISNGKIIDGVLVGKIGDDEVRVAVAKSVDNLFEVEKLDELLYQARHIQGKTTQEALDARGQGVLDGDGERLEINSLFKPSISADEFDQIMDNSKLIHIKIYGDNNGNLYVKSIEELDKIFDVFEGKGAFMSKRDEVSIIINGRMQKIILDDFVDTMDETLMIHDFAKFVKETSDSRSLTENIPLSELIRGSETTKLLEGGISNPDLEYAFIKIKGAVIPVTKRHGVDFVDVKMLDELPDNVLKEVQASIEKGGYIEIHNHPGGTWNSMFPSKADLNNLVLDRDIKSSVIAVSDETGKIEGYLFIKKGKNFDYEMTINDKSFFERELSFLHQGSKGMKTITEEFMSEYGLKYRYVPNRKAGYIYDAERHLFVKEEGFDEAASVGSGFSDVNSWVDNGVDSLTNPSLRSTTPGGSSSGQRLEMAKVTETFGIADSKKFITKKVKVKNTKTLNDAEKEINDHIRKLGLEEKPANAHLVTNPESKKTYMSTDAGELKPGGSKQGRGDWRYLFKRNPLTGNYEFVGLAKHKQKGQGYDWFF